LNDIESQSETRHSRDLTDCFKNSVHPVMIWKKKSVTGGRKNGTRGYQKKTVHHPDREIKSQLRPREKIPVPWFSETLKLLRKKGPFKGDDMNAKKKIRRGRNQKETNGRRPKVYIMPITEESSQQHQRKEEKGCEAHRASVVEGRGKDCLG